jgi:hypothetical protein
MYLQVNTFSVGGTDGLNKFPACQPCANGFYSPPGSPVCFKADNPPCAPGVAIVPTATVFDASTEASYAASQLYTCANFAMCINNACPGTGSGGGSSGGGKSGGSSSGGSWGGGPAADVGQNQVADHVCHGTVGRHDRADDGAVDHDRRTAHPIDDKSTQWVG